MTRSHLRHVVTDRSGNVIQNAAVTVTPVSTVDNFVPGTAIKDPSTLTGLSNWYDFSDITTLFKNTALSTPVTADGDEIKGLADKSGNGNSATLPASMTLATYFPITGPFYKTGIRNGKSIARFVAEDLDTLFGTASALVQTAPFAVPATQPNTLFVVGQQSAGFGYFTDGLSDSARLNLAGDNFGGVFLSAASLSDDNFNVNAHTGIGSEFHAWTGLTKGAQSALWMDGAAVSTGDAGDQACEGITIGSRLDGHPLGMAVGDFCEIIYVEGELSNEDRDGILAYLFDKWDIDFAADSVPSVTMYDAAEEGNLITQPLISNEFGEIDAWLTSPQAVTLAVTDNTNTAFYPTNAPNKISYTDFEVDTKTDWPTSNISDAIQYVSADGDDDKDGLTPATAKQTIMAAYDDSPTSGVAIHLLGAAVEIGAPGIRIIGPQDPDFNSGALTPTLVDAGWRITKRLSIIGDSVSTHAPNSIYGAAVRLIPTDPDGGPTIELASVSLPTKFENLSITTGSPCVRFGYLSDGTPTAGPDGHKSSSAIFFDNCHFTASQTIGFGPTIQIGYAFFFNFEHCTFRANKGATQVTAIAVDADLGGTNYRYTTALAHGLVVGDTVQTGLIAPIAYNFDTPAEVVAVTDSTHFTIDVGSNPAAAVLSGDEFARPVVNNSRACVTMMEDGIASTGFGTIQDSTFSDGGVRYIPGITSWGPLRFSNIIMEGDFDNAAPPLIDLYNTGSIAGLGVMIDNLSVPDVPNTIPVVIVRDPFADPASVTVMNGTTVDGPATLVGWSYRRDDATSPRFDRQRGIIGRHVWAQHDGGRRAFGPVGVRSANLAAATATGGTLTITGGKTAPDGTANAFEASFIGAGSPRSEVYDAVRATSVGDWVIAGIWARQSVSAVTTPIGAVAEASIENGFMDSGNILSAPGFYLDRYLNTDEWQWFSNAGQVVDAGTNLRMSVFATEDHTMEFYGPVLLHIAAADITKAEALELAAHLQSYPSSATAGKLAVMPDLNLHLPKNYIDVGVITAPAAPASDYGRLYVDTSGGKDRLVVRFASGAAQVIATEP